VAAVKERHVWPETADRDIANAAERLGAIGRRGYNGPTEARDVRGFISDWPREPGPAVGPVDRH